MTPAPALHVPDRVRAAFNVRGDAIALAGGEGLSVRVGDVVLKRVHDVEEADWTQDLQSRMRCEGFRVPSPVATRTGRWTCGGWSASQLIAGLRPLIPDWSTITEVGLRFSDAAEAARHDGVELLARRTHRWAVADRVAWGETRVTLSPEMADIHAQIVPMLGTAGKERQLVHGDLAGNVCTDPTGLPVVLDVSPYLRPRRWAGAIVVTDAVLWHGAPLSLATSFAVTPQARDLLGRALCFRLVAEALADGPRHGADLEPFQRVLRALT